MTKCLRFCFRSLLEAGGVDRLMNVTRQRAKYTSRFFLQMMPVMMMRIILDKCFRLKKPQIIEMRMMGDSKCNLT